MRVTCWLTPAEAAAVEAVRGDSEAAVWIREAAVDRAQRRAAARSEEGWVSALLDERTRLALTLPRALVIVCTDAPTGDVLREAFAAGAVRVDDARSWTDDRWRAENLARQTYLGTRSVLVLRDAEQYARARRLAMDLIDVASVVQLPSAPEPQAT